MAGSQSGQIDRDELGQVGRQAAHINLGQDVADDGRALLDRRRDLLIGEVQRHFHVDLAIGSHALEVDMHDLLLEGMPLHVAKQHLLGLAVEFHLEDRRMEGLDPHRVIKRVMVDFDGAGLTVTAIDDAGHFARKAQSAARTRTLRCTCFRDDFHRNSL